MCQYIGGPTSFMSAHETLPVYVYADLNRYRKHALISERSSDCSEAYERKDSRLDPTSQRADNA